MLTLAVTIFSLLNVVPRITCNTGATSEARPGETDFRPTDISYIRSEATSNGVIGAVLVILCAVGTVVFVIVRCGCMCTGRGFCLKPAEQSTSRTRKGIQAAVVVFSLGALAGAVLAVVGTSKVATTVSNLVDITVKEKGLGELNEYLQRLQSMTDNAIAVAGDLSGNSGDLSALRQLKGSIEDIERQIDSIEADIVDTADQYVEFGIRIAKMASYVISGLVLALIVLGLVAALLSRKRMLICPLIAVPLWLIFAWLLFTVFNVIHGFMDDTCSDIAGTAQYCHGPEENTLYCNSFYIGSALTNVLNDLNPKQKLIDVTSGINDLVEEANQNLEAAYDQACETVDSLNSAIAQMPSVLDVPGFCTSEQQRELLCLPFTAAGKVDKECGKNPASRYTRLADVANEDGGFARLRCKDIPDMQVALDAAVQSAIQNLQPPSGPAITCASNDRYIGEALFTDIGSKAGAAGAVFDSFDVVTELVELEPMWNILDYIKSNDCPAALDALTFMYAAFCILGTFLMPLSIAWLAGYKYLPSQKVNPEGSMEGGVKPGQETASGMIVGTQPPVAAPAPTTNNVVPAVAPV